MKKLMPIPQYETNTSNPTKEEDKKRRRLCESGERKEKIIEHESGGDGAQHKHDVFMPWCS